MLLARVVSEGSSPDISIQEIMDGLGERAFGLMMILVNLPNLVPMPPGTSTVFAVPMMIFSVQMMLGARQPWLPAGIRNRRLPRATMSTMVIKCAPYLARFEKICRPRLEFLTSRFAERLIGLYLLILAIVLSLPIPLGNFPPSVAAIVIALGLVERDGRAVLIGFSIGLIALLIASTVVLAMWAIAWLTLTQMWAVVSGWF